MRAQTVCLAPSHKLIITITHRPFYALFILTPHYQLQSPPKKVLESLHKKTKKVLAENIQHDFFVDHASPSIELYGAHKNDDAFRAYDGGVLRPERTLTGGKYGRMRVLEKR